MKLNHPIKEAVLMQKTVHVKYKYNNNHSFYDKDYFGYKNHHCLDFNTFSYACQQYVNY